MPSDKQEVKRIVKNLETAYRHTFNNEMANTVLADLRVFCHATKTTYSGDVNQALINEGKRQVFYRIMNYLKVDYSEIYGMEEDY